MLSQRAVSGVKLLSIGSLGLFSSAVLFLGTFIALLMWAPWWLALKIFDVPTLDVFRIFYASSYTVLAPALLFGGATGFALSTIIAKKSKASKKSIFYVMLSVVFVGLFMAGAFVPSVTAISATQTQELNQFKGSPCTYYIFPDTSTTVNYYAQNCSTGAIDYGGPGNAGGATGTAFSSVFQKIVSTAPAYAVFSPATYTVDKNLTIGTEHGTTTNQGLTLNGLDPENTIFEAASTMTGTGAPAILTINARHTTIENIQFNCNNVASSYAISSGTGGQTGAKGLQNLTMSRVWATNCKTNVGAINVQGWYGVWLDSLELWRNVNPFYENNNAYWHITNMVAHNNTQAVVIAGGDGRLTSGSIYGSTNVGLDIDGGVNKIGTISVIGMEISSNALEGVYLNNANVTLTGNTIYGNGDSAGASGATSSGIDIHANSYVTIIGNQIYTLGASGGPKYKQAYGIYDEATSNSGSIIGNRLIGATTAQIHLTSTTMMVQGNSGYNNVGLVQFTATPNYGATTVVMVGIAWSYTPKTTSITVFLHVLGYSSVANDGFYGTIRYGTGTAPTQGAAATGTNPCYALAAISPAATSASADTFCQITGLTPGTAYWFDIAWQNEVGGTATIQNALMEVQDPG